MNRRAVRSPAQSSASIRWAVRSSLKTRAGTSRTSKYLQEQPFPNCRLPLEALSRRSVPTDLNSGDIVCVHGGNGDTPLKLSVVPRTDVHRAQADFLAGWQRNSLYGTLSSVNVSGRSFIVTPLPPSADNAPVRVSLPRVRATQNGAAECPARYRSHLFPTGRFAVGRARLRARCARRQRSGDDCLPGVEGRVSRNSRYAHRSSGARVGAPDPGIRNRSYTQYQNDTKRGV